MSKNNESQGFEALATMIVGVLLFCWACSVVKSWLHAISLWVDLNWPLLTLIFWRGLVMVLVFGSGYVIYEFVSRVVTHAIDTDTAIAEINAKIQELTERTQSQGSSLREQVTEDRRLWTWIQAIDGFTGFKEHREMEKKAKEAKEAVAGQPVEAKAE